MNDILPPDNTLLQWTPCPPAISASCTSLAGELQLLSPTLLGLPFTDASASLDSPAHSSLRPLQTSNRPVTDDTHINDSAYPASSSTSFPDSYFLAVPPLTLLRGLVRIATRLNAASSVWSLTSTSPFNLGLGPDPSDLPAEWQPTPTQVLTPHHPVLDLLPWPAVRDRMIGVISLGDNGMDGVPSTSGSPLVDFIYDIEDVAEGIRIWGSDPYDQANWEVGQTVFEHWWFVFDKGVVERSNHWRRQRGAPPLRALPT